ncbi:hypothetical protein [Helicobacter mehlei]|uniref:Lipoprotein n=1 Tax=Helicobacter mehlei TaxID=2316080 RepID=A0A553UQK3_9HELI|nr:hypothetical protein [Helicobacter mehlei]TSA82499.1 hypothetical protein FNE76_05715 [Helicobacter mehlei]
MQKLFFYSILIVFFTACSTHKNAGVELDIVPSATPQPQSKAVPKDTHTNFYWRLEKQEEKLRKREKREGGSFACSHGTHQAFLPKAVRKRRGKMCFNLLDLTW